MGYYVPPPLPSVYAAPPRPRISIFRRVVAWGGVIAVVVMAVVTGVCFVEYAAKAVSVVMR